MIVSTKGRYALRVLTDLAEQEAKNGDTQRTPLKEIAERQDISQKYPNTDAQRGKGRVGNKDCPVDISRLQHWASD